MLLLRAQPRGALAHCTAAELARGRTARGWRSCCCTNPHTRLAANAVPSRKPPMYVGDQDVGLSKPSLQFLVRHGVRNVDAMIGDSRDGVLTLTEADFREAIDTAAAEGVRLEMTHINLPESITLGLGPQRDVDIAQVCQCIENAGKAGLRGLNYNFLVGSAYARTPETLATKGRGGTYHCDVLSNCNTAALHVCEPGHGLRTSCN